MGEIKNMKELVQASDIVLFPVENMLNKMDYPLVLLEAMAAGKLVIFSDTKPLDEIYEPKCNVMIDDISGEKLGEEILKGLIDKAKTNQMEQKAKTLVKEKYNITDSAKKYLDIYSELLSSK